MLTDGRRTKSDDNRSPDLKARSAKKGGNPNLIDCNAIAQNKKREATPI